MFLIRADTEDSNTYREVVTENCYRLPDDMGGLRVLDAGANIGCFVKACLDRDKHGTTAFLCLEPDSESNNVLHVNYPCTPIRKAALWLPGMEQAQFQPGVNSACHKIMDHGKYTVPVWTLDGVLSAWKAFDLLKLDIEGAEYGVLYTSKLFTTIPTIIGELHEVAVPFTTDRALTVPALLDFLRESGYRVHSERHPNSDSNHLFWATR